MRKAHIFLILIALIHLGAAQAGEGRTRVRMLYSFEKPGEDKALMKFAENLDVAVVADNGVTDGAACARITAKRGVIWATFSLGADKIKDWSDYDYFAMDLYTEDAHPYRIVFELWDGRTKNYHTRFTIENVAVHPGRQTLLYPINRAKRNGKEGRDWNELEPQDKINLNGLRKVKIFLTPRKDRDAVFWVDNFRLMQEDAAKPKMKVKLPAGAIAFDFGSGGDVVPGFKGVTPKSAAGSGAGFRSTAGLANGGTGWPDLLSGTFVHSPKGGPIDFTASVPDGEYRLWLCAGRVIHPGLKSRRYLLRVNGETLVDETPSYEEFCGEKYLYRFLWTQYSEKQHALWRNYVARMYPVITRKVSVTDGRLRIEAVNHFLSGAILVPASRRAAFDRMRQRVRDARIEAFENTYYAPKRARPTRAGGDGDAVVFVPDFWRHIQPWDGPSDSERKRTDIRAAGAPGQRIVMRVAVTPFEDLGRCELELADLTGPGTIPASSIRGYFKNYRSDGKGVGEMALLPSLKLNVEKGVSQCFWLWMKIPERARAGKYSGAFNFVTGRGKRTRVPVSLEVYPFQLEPVLPVSYGMYYSPRRSPPFPADVRRRKVKEQLEWMREIGFTATAVGGPSVRSIDGASERVRLSFGHMSEMFELAREVGMARHPDQRMMATSLGTGRAIARRLPAIRGAKVDQNPGIELRQPRFRGYYLNAMGQYRDYLKKIGLPVAVEIVDEPREVPNPWNRNLADTNRYGDMLHEVGGITTFVTPMGDTQSGKDYTSLVDHADIVSVHATRSSRRMMAATRAKGKTLWFYNTGMGRFSWGFYNWAAGSKGRWEWHFRWSGGGASGGYPGTEWYNPFTGSDGKATNAPYGKYRGGMLFKSEYLRTAQGISDYAYLITLQKAIARNKDAGTNARTVAEADKFLAALKRVIPPLPRIKGIASAADGALVGKGIEDEARKLAGKWRARIAGFLKVLAKPNGADGAGPVWPRP